jgi:hypothetical protein
VREEKKECGAFRNVVMTKSSPYFSCLFERIVNLKVPFDPAYFLLFFLLLKNSKERKNCV